jgi:DNA (cytosine-5)-methyltransferase 1
MRLVLSIFPGIDILGRGFESMGFCVVRGPDSLWGGDIRRFHPATGHFEGVIGGSPCQDFSGANRGEKNGYGMAMLKEYARVVSEARPSWWLHENVPGCPDLPAMEGSYNRQRFFLTAAECGLSQRRNRVFTYGYQGNPIVITRLFSGAAASQPCCLASEGKRSKRRSWPDFCAAMGLLPDFDLPGWSIAAKYRAVGNAVPFPMAQVIASAIKNSEDNWNVRLCVCGCGRIVEGKAVLANAACRKRMQRQRDASRVTPPGLVTAGQSQLHQ